MFVMTKKIKCEGRAPAADFVFLVCITDGAHAASFVPDGEGDRVTRTQLAGCVNIKGSRFIAEGKGENKMLQFLPDFGTSENMDEQIRAALEFVERCMSVPIKYHVPGAEHTYLV